MTSEALWTDAGLPLLVLAAAWLTPALSGPTLPFGVRVPAEHADEPVIAEQRSVYRRWLAGAGGVLVLLGAALAFAAPASPLRALPAVLSIALCLPCYLRARHAILAVKQHEGWYRGLRQAVTVDTTLRTDPEPFPWLWGLPALLLTAATAVLGVLRYPAMPQRLPTHYNGSGVADHFTDKSVAAAFVPVYVQLGLTALLGLTAWFSFRSRADLDPARPAASAFQHRRFVVRMAASVLLLTACADLTLLVAAWGIWHGDHTMAALPLLLPVLLGTLGVIAVAVVTGQSGSRIAAPAGPDTGAVHQDDDRYWRAGLFYVNREDPAFFVPKRFGVGWSVNLGNPWAALLLAVLLGGGILATVLNH
ncbi:putative membrane protein [Kitasatospora sp. MAP12-15]|uniref:DUF1648 domain-containing protein n=1 Tax=unclassified Kitasatospora TaxID=2633591 RepID=UPI0024769DFE|nr:DUF5808 domain-containing protein [Kitasatospora sp. MAP12-44]MDH6112042.1 putative membrane protein [Kitasatospora sp. MAP12-44]